MRTELNGLVAVVTRPIVQARKLLRLIERAGGRAIGFPTLEIAGITDVAPLIEQAKQLSNGDWLVFISANAVEFGVPIMDRAGVEPCHLKIVSIGRATSEALQKHGLRVDLACPPPASSESLLATPEMNAISGRRIFIFRGVGGRPLLGTTLAGRGAVVEYVECYRRNLPQLDSSVLAPTCQRGTFNVTITTSVDGLRNFMDIVSHSGYGHLLRSDLVVIGERQRGAARRLGWAGTVSAVEDAGNELIMSKLAELIKTRN